MSLTAREFWTVVHGMILGSFFLLAFAGGLAGLSSLGPEWVTAEGLRERTRRLIGGTWVMGGGLVSGTFFVYPWYRAKPPAGTTDLTSYPRYLLLAKPEIAGWHKFGMEWKEHVAWLAPILATAVAYVVVSYGPRLAHDRKIRQALIVLFVLAFAAAGAAGLFGAFINKVAATR